MDTNLYLNPDRYVNRDTKYIVGYDGNDKPLWYKAVHQDYWLLDGFTDILKRRLGLDLTAESIKQLDARKDDFSGVDFFWDLDKLCQGEPDHDLVVNAWLRYPSLGIDKLKTFCLLARHANAKGAAFTYALAELAVHGSLDKVSFPEAQSDDANDVLIDEVLAANPDKLKGEPEKIANFLVGQVMKKVPDRKAVDVGKLKERIIEKIGAGGGI